MDTGIVTAFAGTKVPQGWELCDGRMLDKHNARYAALFEVIGTIHGGDANPSFQLPDYRGMFLRGVDLNRGLDDDRNNRRPPGKGNTGNSGNAVGSVQDDDLARHAHTLQGFHLEAREGHGFDGAGFDTNSGRSHPMTHAYGSSAIGGAETRPKNVYVNYIIKL